MNDAKSNIPEVKLRAGNLLTQELEYLHERVCLLEEQVQSKLSLVMCESCNVPVKRAETSARDLPPLFAQCMDTLNKIEDRLSSVSDMIGRVDI